jgi:hypothetical protein
MATESATPVHRCTRLSVVTGQGSRWRSSRMDSSVKLGRHIGYALGITKGSNKGN